jgi:hypothetical protein
MAAGIAASVVSAAMIWHVDLVNIPFGGFHNIEPSEIDDIAVALVLLVAAVFVDLMRARVTEAVFLQAERVRVVQATMRTVQDIVNNALNQLQVVRLEAEGHVPDASLTLFDEVIHETAARLNALGDLEAYTEKQMAMGSGLDTQPFR